MNNDANDKKKKPSKQTHKQNFLDIYYITVVMKLFSRFSVFLCYGKGQRRAKIFHNVL